MRSGPLSVGKWLGALAICAVLAVLAFLAAAAFGEQTLSWDALGDPDGSARVILFSVRLPRVVLAALVGASLAAVGAMLQSLLRNPLADPFVLGVSGGSALGATVALVYPTALFAWVSVSARVSLMAWVGAMGATFLVLTVGRLAGGRGTHATLLAGVIFNAFALAAITFLKALVAPDRLGEILYWLAGALGHETWGTLAQASAVVAVALLALMALAPRLNLLALGSDDAQSLGVNVQRTQLVLLAIGSVAVAAVVSLSGLVGFVGLLVPQLARIVFGADQRVVLPTSAFLGAAFLMLADLLARLSFRALNTEPPVGVITALLGGPLFLALMAGKLRASGSER